MPESSNSKQRVEIDASVFGHRVVGTLTGRTMSTPDAGKPELAEVSIMRTDDQEGLVWVPKNTTAYLDYEVSVVVPVEGIASPTDAVLSTLDYLRSPRPGGITFRVFCPDDRVTYRVEAEQNESDDTWAATVVEAYEKPKSATAQPEVRHDLLPTPDAS